MNRNKTLTLDHIQIPRFCNITRDFVFLNTDIIYDIPERMFTKLVTLTNRKTLLKFIMDFIRSL